MSGHVIISHGLESGPEASKAAALAVKSAIDLAKAMTEAPTLVLMAQHDEVIPEASTRLLHTRFAPGVATLQVADGVGHNSISQHPAYAQWLAGLR